MYLSYNESYSVSSIELDPEYMSDVRGRQISPYGIAATVS